MNFDDLMWLVDETLKLAEAKSSSPVNNEEELLPPIESIVEPLKKNESGVVYYLESKTASAVLKCLPIRDIESELKKLHSNKVFESSLFSLIQNNKIESIDSLNFYPTNNFNQAELLFKTFADQRYPLKKIHEIENAWWMEYDQSGFKIFFKSYGLLDQDKCIYLGPISNESQSELIKKFEAIIPDLKEIFHFKEYQLTPNVFSFRSEGSNSMVSFNSFLDLFISGKEWDFDNSGVQLGPASIELLRDLALKRRFWLQLTKILL